MLGKDIETVRLVTDQTYSGPKLPKPVFDSFNKRLLEHKHLQHPFFETEIIEKHISLKSSLEPRWKTASQLFERLKAADYSGVTKLFAKDIEVITNGAEGYLKYSGHYIGKNGFAIAIAMNNEAGENLILDPQYFNLSVSQANYVLHSDGFYSNEYIPIPYGAWEQDFSYVSEDLVNRNIIQKAAWLKSNDYYISSNYLANVSSYLEISLK